MTDLYSAPEAAGLSRSDRLDRAIHALLSQTPEIEAVAVVSFDGLPMAAALPPSMDEDRVAAMSAALLSLGERAAQGLGRGELSQVYIEGTDGTVFLVSAEDEAVLVAVAAKGAKVGMMLYEVRRSAAVVAAILSTEDDPVSNVSTGAPYVPAPSRPTPDLPAPDLLAPEDSPAYASSAPAPRVTAPDSTWTPSYLPTSNTVVPPPSAWS
ncbi:MAG: roadblock/LC7 domain-containing protein [Actinobacteria bacterium]|nr:roadblock/LC7 domain-containing protein [Actinomycetota bacterium]MBW3647925.1 roadblock/LC7 domain-containing protein [Actinomycetota bacterium]